MVVINFILYTISDAKSWMGGCYDRDNIDVDTYVHYVWPSPRFWILDTGYCMPIRVREISIFDCF